MKLAAALSLATLTAAATMVGCSNNKPKTAANTSINPSVTDVRASAPVAVAPAPTVVPVQQPVQPVVSDTSPTVVASAAPAPAISGNVYTVQKGDTLFKIARAKYGDASAVKK
ncbi:MAG TPA: LysM peptidoglycan-binding domain-containing protein, partial [Tepidisphaeraceae bacterium]